ncbi:RNA-guided endonuclease InsQ/TnpB family protein [Streptomyces sp. NPDC058622]|uniref:RNA-guided endonuclease InsQ/TnpB family protein n=1 Tax=Streptomyces sp. NPDC058622 TaxID=3346562 RepID=UPI00364EE27A
MPRQEVLKAFKFTLDPNPEQVKGLCRHAGASRWAFNHALGMKRAAHAQWRSAVEELIAAGQPEAAARKAIRIPTPTKPAIQKHLNSIKGDSRAEGLPDGVLGPQRPCAWWHEVNTYAFQSAFIDADTAWSNWLSSLSGKRAGRKSGYPRFKKKGSRDSFRLHHDTKRPSIRTVTYRRLRLPTIGEVRLHDNAKRLARLIGRGHAVVQSVTVSRAGHRWYAAVLCKVVIDIPDRATRAQRERGTVGIDLGVSKLATLSKPLTTGAPDTGTVANPRHVRRAERRLAKAQRKLSRTRKGSARREQAKRRVGRLHHEVAVRREGFLHTLTKQVITRFAHVGIEGLHITGMTATARGTLETPGRRVRQKAGLNRSSLDASFGEIRRQLTYKAAWYGTRLTVLDRWYPSSKTCSACGWQNPRLTLTDRTFTCDVCHLSIDRDLNAARNIERVAGTPPEPQVAPGRGETQNARGAPVSPDGRKAGRHGTKKREGTSRHRPVPPQRDNPLASPNPRQEQAKLF